MTPLEIAIDALTKISQYKYGTRFLTAKKVAQTALDKINENIKDKPIAQCRDCCEQEIY